MNKYRYEYFKKDNLTGNVLDYKEATVEESNFSQVFDEVLANHFFRDEMADGLHYYQVLVWKEGVKLGNKCFEERIYLNSQEHKFGR